MQMFEKIQITIKYLSTNLSTHLVKNTYYTRIMIQNSEI